MIYVKKKLVIVESPSKSHTIGKYLGNNYKVVASKGHIRDLATSGKFGLGVDVDNGFTPTYKNVPGKSKLIKELKDDVKNSEYVYLATDPDREGEAISWHLKNTLDIKDDKYSRVLFHEITKNAVEDAMKNPTKIDDNLVRSQETRRILDRIIGFRLSKLLQNKIGAKSAGRVQSVALKLIVDKEREIEAFNPEEYWTITAKFLNPDLESDLFKYKDEEIKLKNKEETDNVLNKLTDKFKVESVTKKKASRASKPPFTTSTLQQEASTKIGFSAKKTMSVAQKLYEGIDLKKETVGLITYMRTDSIRLSDEFIKRTYKYINDTYGKEYVGFVKKTKKTDNVQDAHEAIRPTSIDRTPESVKSFLTPDEYKLYNLIYKRALASLMNNASLNQTTIILDNNDYKFKSTGSVITFDGYLKVYEFDTSDDKILPVLKEGEILTSDTIDSEQHFTKPPARYSEAKLIKEMEELGIGRPSTYAKIIDTIKERGYVEMVDKRFKPTEIGITTTDKLQEDFSDFINVKYTANMEDELDKIADGKLVWNNVLKDFYDKFEPRVEESFKTMEKVKPKETGEMCPECGSPLVIRKGRYGEFTACSNYPNCKYIKKEKKEVKEIMSCPKCHDGKVIERKTKKGKIFYGCSNYPKCKFATWDLPIDEKCPKCGEILVDHKGTIKCSSCDYTKE